jgi:hypothetical protein
MALAVPPREDRLANYVNLFADNVEVFEDDTKVASSRDQFLAYLRSRNGLHVRVLQLSVGNPLLVTEEVDNFQPFRRDVIQDCCNWARLATYHFGQSGKVDRVSLVGNGRGWDTAKNGR